jgi:Xaa-Pro dipeptidase
MNNRFARLLDLMKSENFGFAVINPGFTFKYLTQLEFHLMERPVVLFVKADGKNALVLPELEVSRAEKSGLFDTLFPYGDNPADWHKSFEAAALALEITDQTIAVEPNRFRFLELNFLKESCPRARILSGAAIFEPLRICKDPGEIDEMSKSAEIAEKALISTLPLIKPNVTEKELASELVLQCLRGGADSEFPFGPIVAFGENSANPHATPSERKLHEGDLLLFDWGVSLNGYASDITRCFAYKYIDPQMQEIAAVVHSANQAGRSAGKPGLAAGEVDKATRSVIEKAGYGQYFTHRTGHGLGMEAHEGPYIFSANDLILKTGMVYTIEPGIYLPGIGGVRIEDDVVVTEHGSRSITGMDRDLKIIP